MKIRIVMDSSGPGSIPAGTILEVGKDISKADAENLLEVRSGHSSAVAVPVVEDRAETADAPEKRGTEKRDAPEKPAEREAAAEPAEPEEEPKRAPGRPPGSTNKPRPQ
jgi:hypothetical protein